MQEAQELLERLNLRGKPLSKGQRRIAEYIAQHYDRAVLMTATQLGRECGVSESTVVRFASALGYEGYPELLEMLRSLVRQRLTSEQRFALLSGTDRRDVLRTVLKNDMQNIRKTVEELSQEDFDHAVDCMRGANRLYVMGLRSSAPLAQFMYHYLHQIFDEVTLVQDTSGDVFEEIVRIGSGDVLIGISYPRYSTRTLECMRFARENGAQVIGMTDGEMSPLHEASDICLCAHTDMTGFVDSLAAPLSLVNALIVSLGLSRSGELSQHFKRLEGIWNAHSVYIDKANE
ncbi:MAG: MurR/RpiR family transcriptional regulator [Eubacteriales bacterium]|nr:MurR/RpiR family transcriptional regulator [Eubacteriales bacterium]